MSDFTPFFINSNLITSKSSLTDYDTFFNAVAGNTGNSYITWALLKELGVVELKDDFHIQNIYDFDFSCTDRVSEFINSNCSHVFLILQDQIRIAESYGYKLPYKGIKNLLEKINKPVIVAGLGANSFTGFDLEFYRQLPSDLVEFLHFLSGRCSELGVRGNFTAEVLNQLGIKNVTPIGCPSFFETGPNRIIKKKNFITEDRVFFTSNYPSPLNRTAFQVCQDHLEKEIVKAIAFNSIENFASNEVFIDKYIKKRYRIFSDITEWKNFARQFDFSLGYRVHGCILSLNSGIVSVCCNGDSRAKEMCELLKIPHMPDLNPESDMVKLYNEIDISSLNNAYPSLYEKFSSFIKRNCNIEINTRHLTGGGNTGIELYKKYQENCFSILYTHQEQKYTEIIAKIESSHNELQNFFRKQTEMENKINSLIEMETQTQNKLREFDGFLKIFNRLKRTLLARALRKLRRKNL